MSNTVTACVIHPDGEVHYEQITPDLDTLQHLVGGHLEAINPGMETDAGQWTGYVHEEGKVEGLPVNHLGTLLTAEMGWTGPDFGDFLVGTLVLLGPPDRDGDDTGLPEQVQQFITTRMEVLR